MAFFQFAELLKLNHRGDLPHQCRCKSRRHHHDTESWIDQVGRLPWAAAGPLAGL